MDARGMEQAALLGISEGGPLSALFAATYPERCRALVLYGSFARFSSWFPTEEALAAFLGYIDTGLGHRRKLALISRPRSRMIRPPTMDGTRSSGSAQARQPLPHSCE